MDELCSVPNWMCIIWGTAQQLWYLGNALPHLVGLLKGSRVHFPLEEPTPDSCVPSCLLAWVWPFIPLPIRGSDLDFELGLVSQSNRNHGEPILWKNKGPSSSRIKFSGQHWCPVWVSGWPLHRFALAPWFWLCSFLLSDQLCACFPSRILQPFQWQ